MTTNPRGRAVPLAPTSINVVSGFGYHTQSPFVEFTLNTEKTQMTPAKAREIAGMLLEAAEAAEADGFVVTFMQTSAGLTPAQAGSLLLQFRDYRTQERKRQEQHDWPEAPAS